VGWLSAALLLVRKEAFRAVSGFDESFFLFGEDVDLGRRLAAAGFVSKHVPSVTVGHEGGASYRGGPLEGTWTLGLRRAHARSGASGLARAAFAALLALGLFERALASRGAKRARLLRAARLALSSTGPEMNRPAAS
jgi:GT2 family glycosyltransferase